MHLCFPKIHIVLPKRRAAHLWPPEIIYFKKGPKLCIFSSQSTKFSLARGALPPCNPQHCIYIKILTEKGLNLRIYGFPKIHILLRKGGLTAPLQLPEIISVNLDQKRPQILCIFSLQNTKFSKARLSTPATGPASWTPMDVLRKRSVCSLCSQLFEFPQS